MSSPGTLSLGCGQEADPWGGDGERHPEEAEGTKAVSFSFRNDVLRTVSSMSAVTVFYIPHWLDRHVSGIMTQAPDPLEGQGARAQGREAPPLVTYLQIYLSRL